MHILLACLAGYYLVGVAFRASECFQCEIHAIGRAKASVTDWVVPLRLRHTHKTAGSFHVKLLDPAESPCALTESSSGCP